MQKPILKKLIIFIIAVTLPLSLHITWHLANKGYPILDEAEYMLTAHKQYSIIKNTNFIQGVQSLYFIRGWRPILHPTLTTPALIFFNGNFLLAISTTTTILFIIFLTYIYRIGNLYLPPHLSGILTVIIGTVPGIIISFHFFTTECSFPAFSILSLFHFLKIKNFKQSKNTILFGFFTGITLCIRPILGIIIFLPPIIIEIIISHKKSEFKLKNALLALTLVIGIPLLWFSPFLEKLIYWVHTAEFSSLSGRTGSREYKNKIHFFFHLLKIICSPTSLYLIIHASLYYFSKTRIKIKSYSSITFMIFLPILIIVCSNNNSIRYLLIPFIFFHLFIIISALKPLPHWKKRYLSILPIIIFQFATSTTIIKFPKNTSLLERPPLLKSYPYKLYNKLKENISPSHTNIKIALLHLIPQSNTNNIQPQEILMNDPGQIQIFIYEDNLTWQTNYPFNIGGPKNTSLFNIVKKFEKEYHYIVISNLNGRVDNHWLPNISGCAKFLDLEWEKNKLNLMETDWIKTITFKKHDNALLIKTKKK